MCLRKNIETKYGKDSYISTVQDFYFDKLVAG